jgi:hypothetical protein
MFLMRAMCVAAPPRSSDECQAVVLTTISHSRIWPSDATLKIGLRRLELELRASGVQMLASGRQMLAHKIEVRSLKIDARASGRQMLTLKIELRSLNWSFALLALRCSHLAVRCSPIGLKYAI